MFFAKELNGVTFTLSKQQKALPKEINGMRSVLD
jgi:hypothetical protein